MLSLFPANPPPVRWDTASGAGLARGSESMWEGSASSRLIEVAQTRCLVDGLGCAWAMLHQEQLGRDTPSLLQLLQHSFTAFPCNFTSFFSFP